MNVFSLVSSILGTAVVVAGKAATTAAAAAFSTAKDVYYTLQARNEVPVCHLADGYFILHALTITISLH